jgi:voltage-gated potassium channel
MGDKRRLQIAAVMVAVVLVVGIVGFMITDDLGVFDAFYFTVITISTVGYNEPAGGFGHAGRAVALFLVIGGVGSLFYTATVGFEMAVERLLAGRRGQRRARRELSGMQDHVILCGFGNVGRNAYTILRRQSQVVVIEVDPDAAQAARDRGAVVVEGNATQDETLRTAGIDRCRALLASVRKDADNLVIVLSARARRPYLRVVARATEAESESKLRLAGADRVVSPQVVGAHRLASMAVQPELADFVDLVIQGELFELHVEHFEVASGSALDGRSIGEAAIRRLSGASVLAVRHVSGPATVNPAPDQVMEHGDVLIAVGTDAQVTALRSLAMDPVHAG